MTRTRLATDADLSYSYLSEIESGHKEPSPAALDRIASALNTTTTDVLVRSGESML